MRHTIASLLLVLFSISANATTWKEPWQEEIFQKSDLYIKAKVIKWKNNDEATLKVLEVLFTANNDGDIKQHKSLIGKKIKINSFHMLYLCSMSGGHGLVLNFDKVDTSYFLLKTTDDGYALPTPSSGFAPITNGKVYASYRHSYHGSIQNIEDFELTTVAIMKSYHNQNYDLMRLKAFIDKQLAMSPKNFNKDEIGDFFKQHAALECIYHLQLRGYETEIIPFLNDTNNMHNQISAARALACYADKESIKTMIQFLSDSANNSFAQAAGVLAITYLDNKEYIEPLKDMLSIASDKSVGFGGGIMDPRVCTSVPNVKSAINQFLEPKKDDE